MSLDTDDAQALQSSNHHSPFQGLLRFSPRSPVAVRSTKSTRKKFFNEADTAHDEETNIRTPDLDGLNVEDLRSRARANVADHSSQAVFFASLLYHKTYLPKDAILLARAHYFDENYVGCLRVLDESLASQEDDPWEALLLSCQALSKTADWNTVEEIISNACSLDSGNIGNSASSPLRVF